jgi:hypothetical protein
MDELLYWIYAGPELRRFKIEYLGSSNVFGDKYEVTVWSTYNDGCVRENTKLAPRTGRGPTIGYAAVRAIEGENYVKPLDYSGIGGPEHVHGMLCDGQDHGYFLCDVQLKYCKHHGFEYDHNMQKFITPNTELSKHV